MLETTNLVTAQTTIILNMGSEALFSDIKLTRDFGIGTAEELTTHVEIDKIEPRTPFVSLELFKGNGHLLSSSFFIGIDVTSEIIV